MSVTSVPETQRAKFPPIDSAAGLDVRQTYQCDPLNRLQRIQEDGESRDFGCDAFGNMWVPTNSTGFARDSFTPATSAWFDTNNRLANPALGVQHDNAGNLTAIGGFLYEYNADGMVTKATPSMGSATEYRYDGEGRRVTKQTGTGPVTTFVYDAFGGLAAEYGTAPTETGTHYITADHLGSTRLVTDATGAVISRHDYLPFGEEIGADGTTRTTAMKYVTNTALTQRFTGKERDTETGLDYFGARYLSGVLGRWTGADAPFADQHVSDPQSWNLYSYVRNGPLRYVDPDGNETAVFPLFNGKSNVPKPEQTGPMSPRERQFAKGMVQIGIGLGVLASTLGGNPTGPGGAVLVANGVVVSAASFAAGTANTAGALTNTDVSQATEVLSATSNLGGLATTAATGGNLEAGQTAATVTNAVALGMEPQAALANPGTAVDAVQTVLEGGTLSERVTTAVTSAVRGLFVTTPMKPTVNRQPPVPPECDQGVCR